MESRAGGSKLGVQEVETEYGRQGEGTVRQEAGGMRHEKQFLGRGRELGGRSWKYEAGGRIWNIGGSRYLVGLLYIDTYEYSSRQKKEMKRYCMGDIGWGGGGGKQDCSGSIVVPAATLSKQSSCRRCEAGTAGKGQQL